MNQFEYSDLDTKIEHCQYRISNIDKQVKELQIEKRELQEQLDQYIQIRNQNYNQIQDSQHYIDDCYYSQKNYYNQESYFESSEFHPKYNSYCYNGNVNNNTNANNQYQLCSYNEIQEMDIEQCSLFGSNSLNQNPKNDFQDLNSMNSLYDKHNFLNNNKIKSSDHIFDISSREEDNHLKGYNPLILWNQNKECCLKQHLNLNRETKDINQESFYIDDEKIDQMNIQEEFCPEKVICMSNNLRILDEINSPLKIDNQPNQKSCNDQVLKNISVKDFNEINPLKVQEQFDEKSKNNQQDPTTSDNLTNIQLKTPLQMNQSEYQSKIIPDQQLNLTSYETQQSTSQKQQQSQQEKEQQNQQTQQQLIQSTQFKQSDNLVQQQQNVKKKQQNKQSQQNSLLNVQKINDQPQIELQQNSETKQKIQYRTRSSSQVANQQQQQLNSQLHQIKSSDQQENSQQIKQRKNYLQYEQKYDFLEKQKSEISEKHNNQKQQQVELEKQTSKKQQANQKKSKSKQTSTQQQQNQASQLEQLQSEQLDQQQLIQESQTQDQKTQQSVLKNLEDKLQIDILLNKQEKNGQKTKKIKKEKKSNQKNNIEEIKTYKSQNDQVKKGKSQIVIVDVDNSNKSICIDSGQQFLSQSDSLLNDLENENEKLLSNTMEEENELFQSQDERESAINHDENEQNIKKSENISKKEQNVKQNKNKEKEKEKVKKNQQKNNNSKINNKIKEKNDNKTKQNDKNNRLLLSKEQGQEENVEYKKQLIVNLPNNTSLNQKLKEQISYLQDLNEKRARKNSQEKIKQNTCQIIIRQEKLQGGDEKQNTEDSQSSQAFLNNPSNKMNLEVNEGDSEDIKQQKLSIQKQYKSFLDEFNNTKGDDTLKEKGFYRYPSDLKMKIVEFSKYMKLIQIQKDTMISQETIRKWQKRYSEVPDKIIQFDINQ